VVVDVEGNGRQPPEIIELALLPLTTARAATAEDLRTWMVRPAQSIAPVVTRKVHGITDTDLGDAPRWAEVADDIAARLFGRVLVAHHASVERRVIGAHLPGWEPPAVLDTLRLAKAVWPGLPGGYGLDRLTAHAHLADPPARAGQRRHRAGHDTCLTAALFVALLAVLAERGDLSWAQLVTTAALPGPRTMPETEPDEGRLW
jgi:DNA polymerase III epsilon subunit-like protein